MKSDHTLYHVCLAAIKRSTTGLYHFRHTTVYFSNAEFLMVGLPIAVLEDERFICSVVKDSYNFSVLTTRQLITLHNGTFHIAVISKIVRQDYGFFNNVSLGPIVVGNVELENGDRIPFFVETGKAAIVMVYGVGTLVAISDGRN